MVKGDGLFREVIFCQNFCNTATFWVYDWLKSNQSCLCGKRWQSRKRISEDEKNQLAKKIVKSQSLKSYVWFEKWMNADCKHYCFHVSDVIWEGKPIFAWTHFERGLTSSNSRITVTNCGTFWKHHRSFCLYGQKLKV